MTSFRETAYIFKIRSRTFIKINIVVSLLYLQQGEFNRNEWVFWLRNEVKPHAQVYVMTEPKRDIANLLEFGCLKK